MVAASEKRAVIAVVRGFIDRFNKEDVEAASTFLTPETAIIDEFVPYVWHGANAFSDWVKDFGANAEKTKMTGAAIKLLEPKHVDIVGDRAYLVIPANYTFKLNGKPHAEKGSIFTATLQKLEAGWRITGLAWSKN